MCTLIVAQRAHPDFPVVIAANRDEMFDRPAMDPVVLDSRPRIAGGRDLLRDGTWLGVTAGGFFAGLSNQRPSAPPVPAQRSRGEVVLAVLQAGDTAGARRVIDSLDPSLFNGFNLLFGDAGGLQVAYFRPLSEGVRIEAVPDGIHVLPNDRLDSPVFPKAARAREALEASALPRPWSALAARLTATLSSHVTAEIDAPPGDFPPPEWRRALDAMCVHLPKYGTRSATLLALTPGRVAHYEFAAGPPCTERFSDRRSLLT